MPAESKIIPQKMSAPLPPGIFVVVVLAATATGAGAMVFLFNPATHQFYPVCLFHALTGLNCPGCGGTRSLYALLHGHFQAALKDNAFFVLLFAAAAARCIWFAAKKFRRLPAGKFLPANILWVL